MSSSSTNDLNLQASSTCHCQHLRSPYSCQITISTANRQSHDSASASASSSLPKPCDGTNFVTIDAITTGGFLLDDDMIYEEAHHESFALIGKDDGDMQHSVLQQVKELRNGREQFS
ncbi:hypothetical protein QVD17_06906 [Tagetes erecta]|uniref:Uncharacterized protein n=1 Tax=Tagetes erecta TaxID=13708 RepID=A0AAD8LHT3_TARER|nr:hypothetical protein QVD17_06906 [Tagetes erecta]